MGNTNRPFKSSIDVITEICGENLKGQHIVDIGCGSGELGRHLAGKGGMITGIEPGGELFKIAKSKGGGPRYINADGENTGLDDGSADYVIFSKSLHHIPDMAAAINEARRIAKTTGKIVVLEPEADDPAFPVFRLIDDEKEVYQQAQDTLANIVDFGELKRLSTTFFAEKYRVDSAAALIAEMQAIDASRTITNDDMVKFSNIFDQALKHDDTGAYLESWYRCDVFL